MLYALNEAVSLLWRQLNLNYSSLTRKTQGYDFSETHSALLPEDFVSVVSLELLGVTSTEQHPITLPEAKPGSLYTVNPRIEGEHILGWGQVKMVYNYQPREVTLLEDVIDVPDSLIYDLVAITANVVTQQMDAARQRADEAARATSQTREYAGPRHRRGFP
jgi:hypothetical protein